MSLNIKNKTAHQLAAKLAKMTGESMSEAVTQALRERLERVGKKEQAGLAERLLEIGRQCAAHLEEPWRSADHADLLYDENGLPK